MRVLNAGPLTGAMPAARTGSVRWRCRRRPEGSTMAKPRSVKKAVMVHDEAIDAIRHIETLAG
jgi:hypothetical protein